MALIGKGSKTSAADAVTEQEKCLQEYRQAQERRRQAEGEARDQRALAGAHAQQAIPRTAGGAR